MFVINGGMPVEDKIMGIASLEKFLRGRIKVDSKAVNLWDSITISCARTRSLSPPVAPTRKDTTEKDRRISRLPPAARKINVLCDLLIASDLISLHCALTNDTIQIIIVECLHYLKPGIVLLKVWQLQI